MDILTTEVMTLTQISTNSTSDYGVFCTPAYGVFCTPAYGVFCTPAYGVFYTAVALISDRYWVEDSGVVPSITQVDILLSSLSF